jgi:hypothetical protein
VEAIRHECSLSGEQAQRYTSRFQFRQD